MYLDYQQRVVDEKKELYERLVKLNAFFDKPLFKRINLAEQARMKDQADVMAKLLTILEERIKNF